MIHHSISPDHPDLMNLEAIRRWHVDVNGWSDIGYSHVLEQINGHWEVLLGRINNETLAHVKPEGGLNLNKTAYGICCVGNFDVEVPTSGMLSKLRELCLSLMRQDFIKVESVWGHWEAQAASGVPIAERKSCPGRLLSMIDFRASLKNAVP